MKTLSLGIFAFLFAQNLALAQSEQDAACAQYPVYNQFRAQDYNMQNWYQRYRGAPKGSFEEQYALKQAKDASAQMQSLVMVSPMTNVQFVCLESWALETYQQYKSSPTNSTPESTYLAVAKKLLAVATQVFTEQNRMYIAGQNLEYFFNEGSRLYQSYKSSPTNSSVESFYLAVAKVAFDYLVQSADRLRMEFGYSQQAESIGELYYQRYKQSPTNSTPEASTLKVAKSALATSEVRFQQELLSLPTPRLLQLQQMYDTKYRSAPTNSSLESHYLRMRNMAQNELMRRP